MLTVAVRIRRSARQACPGRKDKEGRHSQEKSQLDEERIDSFRIFLPIESLYIHHLPNVPLRYLSTVFSDMNPPLSCTILWIVIIRTFFMLLSLGHLRCLCLFFSFSIYFSIPSERVLHKMRPYFLSVKRHGWLFDTASISKYESDCAKKPIRNSI